MTNVKVPVTTIFEMPVNFPTCPWKFRNKCPWKLWPSPWQFSIKCPWKIKSARDKIQEFLCHGKKKNTDPKNGVWHDDFTKRPFLVSFVEFLVLNSNGRCTSRFDTYHISLVSIHARVVTQSILKKHRYCVQTLNQNT